MGPVECIGAPTTCRTVSSLYRAEDSLAIGQVDEVSERGDHGRVRDVLLVATYTFLSIMTTVRLLFAACSRTLPDRSRPEPR